MRWLTVHKQQSIGIGLLCFAFVAGYQYLYWNVFVDEGDALVIGWLITKGYRPYLDVWALHFPLTYYWVAGVVSLFGTSIFAVRLSVLAFQLSVFAVTMWLTRWYLPIGITALTWNLIGPFYFGHMLIYYTVTGISVAAAFLLTFALLLGKIESQRRVFSALGVLFSIAILSDPFAAFEMGAVALALWLTKRNRKGVLLTALIVGGAVGVCGVCLWWGGVWWDFYDTTIRFTAEVYSQYPLAGSIKPAQLLQTTLTGLFVSDAGWMNRFPLFPITRMDTALTALDAWVFTGMLYRLAVLLASVALLLRRQWLAAGFAYLFAVATLVRAQDFFRAIPFVLFAIAIAAWLLCENVVRATQFESVATTRLAQTFSIVARSLAGFLLGWLMFRGAEYIVRHGDQLTYMATYQYYETRTADIKKLGCGHTDVSLAYYPYDPIFYFYSEMPPASRYPHLLPWVAYSQPEVINSLSSGKKIVYFNTAASIWGFKVMQYAADLLDFLKTNYVEKPNDFFLSPELARACP